VPLVGSSTFSVLGNTAVDGAVVVSVPHAGLTVPDEDAAATALSARGLLRDADLHVEKLAALLPALGVPVVVAHVSRYVLDLNRSPDDVDAEVCPAFERPARSSPRGLCWRANTDGELVLRRPLSVDEVRSRIARIHAPFHDTLSSLLAERRRRHGFAILLDLHSMPSAARGGGAEAQRRVDVVPGDVKGTSCARALSELVHRHFVDADYVVRPNDPYMGGFITRQHGRPSQGVHALQVELSRDLYMNEATFEYLDVRASRLQAMLGGLVEKALRLRLA
jgi:N-formylglutamate amidohydrolase